MTIATPQPLTAAQLARAWGVSRQNVHQLAKKGLIPRRADGLFDEEEATRGYQRNTHPAFRKAAKPSGVSVNDAAVRSVKASREVKATIDARMAKLKFERRAGILVKADDVGRQWFGILRAMRDRLLQVPERLSRVIATELDAHVIKAAMKTELQRILDDAEREYSQQNKNHC